MIQTVQNSESIAKLFKKASHGSGMFETWDAFVSSFAAFLAAGCGNNCEWLTQRADGARRNLTKQAQKDVLTLFDPVIEAFDANPTQDLLGDVYMRLNIGNKAIGQFFTPYHVAQMMADMSFDEDKVTKQIAKHGYVTVNEPAVGGGANVIAFANTLKEHNINYQRHAWFEVQELSELTALTCYVQMSILGMPGFVYIGDTLRMEFQHSLYTPMSVIEDVWTWRMIPRLFT